MKKILTLFMIMIFMLGCRSQKLPSEIISFAKRAEIISHLYWIDITKSKSNLIIIGLTCIDEKNEKYYMKFTSKTNSLNENAVIMGIKNAMLLSRECSSYWEIYDDELHETGILSRDKLGEEYSRLFDSNSRGLSINSNRIKEFSYNNGVFIGKYNMPEDVKFIPTRHMTGNGTIVVKVSDNSMLEAYIVDNVWYHIRFLELITLLDAEEIRDFDSTVKIIWRTWEKTIYPAIIDLHNGGYVNKIF